MGLTIQWIKKNKGPMKLSEDCFKRVKKDCFKFIKSQETTTEKFGDKAGMITVSYTHLTLPTIYSV